MGVFINSPLVTPHFRLSWEGAIIDQPRNVLEWNLAVGSGFGVAPPSPMTAHFQHVVLGGVGYRSDRQLLHWGFRVTAGPLWYRAAFAPGSFYAFENRVVGYAEGRVQAGLRLQPHLRLAAYVGFGAPFTFQRQYPGNTYVGNFNVGVVLDWW